MYLYEHFNLLYNNLPDGECQVLIRFFLKNTISSSEFIVGYGKITT
jgi:hypothetical protein